MSFLKDFKEELSQAVNELVNIDEDETVEASDTSTKEDTKEISKAKNKSKTKNSAANTEPTVKASDKSEEINTLDSDILKEFSSNLDTETLDELFGNKNDKYSHTESRAESNTEKDVSGKHAYSESIDDIEEKSILSEEISDNTEQEVKFDNIDISEYIEAREKAESKSGEDNNIIKELAKNMQSKINDDKLEEIMADDRENKKAALRGMRQEENHAQRDDEGVSLATEEVTEVTRGTMIDGNIVSEGSMNVYGKIKGNVACRGKLVVCGTIIGSSRGAEIFTNNAKIDGDVTSDGSIKIGNGTVIIGNVYGTSAVIAGAVQGDIDVHGPVIIDGTAVVQGNIRSRSVQINNGAAIEGMVSQCYADIDYAALFDKTFSKS